jgi:predicted O-methyltransferase YrrM
MERLLEQYIVDHMTPESDLLEEVYRETHRSVLNPNMVSGHLQGRFLNMLIRMINPTNVVEIGTYTGYSAICIATALAEGATLHTIERNDELEEISSEFIKRSGFGNRVRMYTGDAREIIPEIEGDLDVVFIDGDKREYTDYYNLVIDRVKKGGFIIADNVLWDGKVIGSDLSDPMTNGIRDFNLLIKNDPRVENSIIPLRDGLMIIRKI